MAGRDITGTDTTRRHTTGRDVKGNTGNVKKEDIPGG